MNRNLAATLFLGAKNPPDNPSYLLKSLVYSTRNLAYAAAFFFSLYLPHRPASLLLVALGVSEINSFEDKEGRLAFSRLSFWAVQKN